MENNLYRDEMDREAAEMEALSLRVSLGMRRRLQSLLDADNLTLPQYMAMNSLHRAASGCSMSALAESTYQLSPTMTGIVDRLVERGLVARERVASDRRALRVTLSAEGREMIDRINARKHAWMRRFLEQLSPGEREMIKMALARFAEAVEVVQASAIDPVDELPVETEELVVGN